jgi:hypothetical protein
LFDRNLHVLTAVTTVFLPASLIAYARPARLSLVDGDPWWYFRPGALAPEAVGNHSGVAKTLHDLVARGMRSTKFAKRHGVKAH